MLPIVGVAAVVGVAVIGYFGIQKLFAKTRPEHPPRDGSVATSPDEYSVDPAATADNSEKTEESVENQFTPKPWPIKEFTNSDEVIEASGKLGINDEDLALMLRCNEYTIQDYRNGGPILHAKRHYELCRTLVTLSELLERRLGHLTNGEKEINLWVASNLAEMKRSPPIQDFGQSGLDRAYLHACERFEG
jgi:hypothetical protein